MPNAMIPPGSGETWLFVAAKALFLLLVFAALVVGIRWLFGPGGRLAEPWMQESWEEKRRDDLRDLERRRKAGQLDERNYLRRKRKLEKFKPKR